MFASLNCNTFCVFHSFLPSDIRFMHAKGNMVLTAILGKE